VCRHLAYLGPPTTLSALVLEPPHGLLRQTVVPMDRVAIHIPAASGPLVSTLLMCAGLPLPKAIVACVGGGSNSIGIFYDFLKDKKVDLKVGDIAPVFESKDDQGLTWKSSDHLGKKYIVVIWGTPNPIRKADERGKFVPCQRRPARPELNLISVVFAELRFKDAIHAFIANG
jgi:hypothetical protein